MANRSNKYIHLYVDPVFYDTMFDSERKKMETKLGIKFTHPEFSKFLVKSRAKIVYPKIKIPNMKKGRKRDLFNFNLQI